MARKRSGTLLRAVAITNNYLYVVYAGENADWQNHVLTNDLIYLSGAVPTNFAGYFRVYEQSASAATNSPIPGAAAGDRYIRACTNLVSYVGVATTLPAVEHGRFVFQPRGTQNYTYRNVVTRLSGGDSSFGYYRHDISRWGNHLVSSSPAAGAYNASVPDVVHQTSANNITTALLSYPGVTGSWYVVRYGRIYGAIRNTCIDMECMSAFPFVFRVGNPWEYVDY